MAGRQLLSFVLALAAVLAVTIMPATPTPEATAVPLQAGCDFELNTCGYQQDKSDNFDWSRLAGPTSSVNTGPSTDHTTGTTAGYYMYLEADNRTPNATARLISLTYPGSSYMCLEFWYSMNGGDIGQLKVYAKQGTVLRPPVWALSGDQGQEWQLASTTISAGQQYSIVFEGTRGKGPLGNIALDDILLKNGACPNPGNCDFDLDLCTYVNVLDGDDFDWIRRSGNTTSTDTGPSQDHTRYNEQGFYVYIEASSPQHKGDRAILVSQTLSSVPTNTYRCLTFWYNMHGSGMGTLNVGMKLSDGRLITRWSLSGEQGSVWKFGQLALDVFNVYYKVFFEGFVGNDVHGDIAIDDVMIRDGYCSYCMCKHYSFILIDNPAYAIPPDVTTTTAGTTTIPYTATPVPGGLH